VVAAAGDGRRVGGDAWLSVAWESYQRIEGVLTVTACGIDGVCHLFQRMFLLCSLQTRKHPTVSCPEVTFGESSRHLRAAGLACDIPPPIPSSLRKAKKPRRHSHAFISHVSRRDETHIHSSPRGIMLDRTTGLSAVRPRLHHRPRAQPSAWRGEDTITCSCTISIGAKSGSGGLP